MIDSLEGRWEGLMFHIEGFSANVTLDLDRSGEGKFTFTLVGDHCPGEPRTGAVQAKLSRDGVVAIEVRGENMPPFRFEGRATEVKVHARAAITGTFTSADRQAEGGVAIMWLYADNA